MRLRILLALVAIVFFSSRAEAHDHWLVPNKLVLNAPADVNVRLLVGEAFIEDEEKPFEAQRMARVVLIHQSPAGGEWRELSGVDGTRPFLKDLHVDRGGNLLVVNRIPATIELAAREFEAYLRDEGLEGPLAERLRRGEKDKPGREQYGRSLKMLVQVGDDRDGTYATEVGQSIEIIPREDPVHLDPGSVLHVLVKFHGAPLAGLRVDAMSRDRGVIRNVTARTDANGVAALPIDRRAVWMIRLVHMVRCETCEKSDWESFWSSYVFASAHTNGAEVIPPPMTAMKTSTNHTRRNVLAFVFALIGLAVMLALMIDRDQKNFSV